VDMFELNTTSNTRGHSKKMKIKTSRLNVRKYTFVVRFVEIWNSLPESVIQAKTVKNFEIGLDEHWKHQECKYDFTANINIRSNSGSDVKSLMNEGIFSNIQPTCFYLHLLAMSTGAWGMDFVSSSSLFSTTPPLFSKFSYKSLFKI
jgi:hypothetical protein